MLTDEQTKALYDAIAAVTVTEENERLRTALRECARGEPIHSRILRIVRAALGDSK